MQIPFTDNLEWRIRTFFNYWRQRHEFINNLDPSRHNHEANVLLWASLDALSNLWAMNIGKEHCHYKGIDYKRNKRLVFDAFLAHYGGELFQLVSLPDVWIRIDRGNPETKQKLPDNVCNFLRKIGERPTNRQERDISDWAIRQISHDWSIDKIITEALKSCELKYHDNFNEEDKKRLEKWLILSRYGAIAYKEMRSAYIHEGQPGSGTHGFNDNEKSLRQPTYATSIHVTPPAIGFSVGFMLQVLEDCINKFETESLTLQQDPAPADGRLGCA